MPLLQLLAIQATIKKILLLSISMLLIEDSLDQCFLELILINVKAKIKRNLKFLEETALEEDMETIQNLILMDLFSLERMSLVTISSLEKLQDHKDLGIHPSLSKMYQLLSRLQNMVLSIK